MKPDLIFECSKCGKEMYVDKTEMDKIVSLSTFDCPECGEEGYKNWIFVGEGDFAGKLR